jgi:hypothetical protein
MRRPEARLIGSSRKGFRKSSVLITQFAFKAGFFPLFPNPFLRSCPQTSHKGSGLPHRSELRYICGRASRTRRPGIPGLPGPVGPTAQNRTLTGSSCSDDKIKRRIAYKIKGRKPSVKERRRLAGNLIYGSTATGSARQPDQETT